MMRGWKVIAELTDQTILGSGGFISKPPHFHAEVHSNYSFSKKATPIAPGPACVPMVLPMRHTGR